MSYEILDKQTFLGESYTLGIIGNAETREVKRDFWGNIKDDQGNHYNMNEDGTMSQSLFW